MAASHVPKFGNWDGDNVPYTAYFDHARKGKSGAGGKMINPNDPEENPDAFSFMSSPEKQTHDNYYHRNSKKNMSSFSISEANVSDNKSSSSNSGKRHEIKRSDVKKNKNEQSSHNSFAPTASPNTPRHGRRSNPYDDLSCRSASVPKFGGWDEMDPKSGEGYTVLFNKVKEEKQIAASKLPNVNQHPNYYSTYTDKPSKSKMFCCLF